MMPTAKGNLRPKVIDGVPEMIKKRKQQSKEHYDKTAKIKPELEIGDHVRLQPTHPRQPWASGAIAAKVGPRSVVVETEDGKKYRRNTKWVKKDDKSTRTARNLMNTDNSHTALDQATDRTPQTQHQEAQIADPDPTPELPPTATVTPSTDQNLQPNYITRSGRTINKPARYKDN